GETIQTNDAQNQDAATGLFATSSTISDAVGSLSSAGSAVKSSCEGAAAQMIIDFADKAYAAMSSLANDSDALAAGVTDAKGALHQQDNLQADLYSAAGLMQMPYYYEELGRCIADLQILEQIQANCNSAEGEVQVVQEGLNGLANSTTSDLQLSDPGSLSSVAQFLGNNLCQAIADIRSAYDTLSSQISEQADYYRRQNAIEDQRQREAQAASQ
ncbi:MAG: hypothetical protein DUD39_15085, partial [Coriobacteriaceae bacterium]